MLNIVIMEMLEGHPVRDVKLKEVLGHTPLQVPCGYIWRAALIGSHCKLQWPLWKMFMR